MTQLTPVQLANVATLAVFLETSVTDEQYHHRAIDYPAPQPVCAAGHAYRNATLFNKDTGVKPNWFQRLLGLTPKPEQYTTNPDVARDRWRNVESAFAKEAFGQLTWDNAFAHNAFEGTTTSCVTRRMVIHRLNQIACDGPYTPEVEAQAA